MVPKKYKEWLKDMEVKLKKLFFFHVFLFLIRIDQITDFFLKILYE